MNAGHCGFAAPGRSGNVNMVGEANITDQANGKAGGSARAAWSTPRVIVSDLADAQANTIIPGGDGCDPIFVSYCYGS